MTDNLIVLFYTALSQGLGLIETQYLTRYHRLTHSLMSSLASLTIFALFVDRFGRSLRFYHQEFDKEAISDCCRIENARYRWEVLNIKLF